MSQSNGYKKVGYFCVYTPVELISAAGAMPIRLFKGGDSIRVASGEVYTESYFCQFPSYSVGAFREGDTLYKSIDKIYTFYTCDQMKKGVEAISEFFNVPTKILCLPREREREASREFMLREVREFQTDLEGLTGQKVSEEGLKREIARYNCARRLLKQISELRKRKNPPISGGEFLELVKAFYYLPVEKSLAYYEGFYGRLASEKGNGQPPIRIMMSGGIIADGDRRLVDLIEKDLGAQIVVEDHCTGLRPFYYPIPEDQEPLKALAEGYLDIAPCARMKPLHDRLDFSEKLALEYRVDAVIYVSLKFCSCYSLSKSNFLKRFQKLGIPVLDISIDYSQSDLGQLRTRVEAFFELMKKGDRHVPEPA
jgi:benzoyl-CoA reductase/2-hydroxyglutaryl-CoA dehydratase subunit BcrC/BadD/HgdB